MASAAVNRFAHRVAVTGVAVWFGYGFFATGGFTRITSSGLMIYLAGLALCYVGLYYAVRLAAWVLRTFWEQS